MENIIVLTEWSSNSFGWGGANIMVIVLAILLGCTFGGYMLCLLIDKDSFTFLLVLSIILMLLIWPPLNNCIQHRGETFQRIAAPPQVTQQELEEKYDTANLITKTENCPEGMVCWEISFKQVD